MKRTHLYYILSIVVTCVMVSGILNSQLIIVGETASGSGIIGRELYLYSWGALVYALGSLSLAWLSDRFGRVRCIGAVALFIAILNGILGWNILGGYKLWHLFLYWGLFNLALPVFYTAVEALLSEYQDHRLPLARRLGLYCLSWCSGDALGAYITGYTKQLAGPQIVYQGLFFLCMAAFILALFDLMRHGSKKLGDQELKHEDIKPEAAFYARLGRTGIFFGCLVWGSLWATFPRFGRDFHHLSEGEIGDLLSTIFFTDLVIFLWFPFWKRWQYNAVLQIVLQCAIPAGLLTAIFTPSGSILLLRISFILIGIGWSVSYFFSIFYSLSVPKNHGQSGGLHEGFLGLGSLTGSLAAIGLMTLSGRMNLIDADRLGAVALLIGFFGMLLSLSLQTMLLKNRNKSLQGIS